MPQNLMIRVEYSILTPLNVQLLLIKLIWKTNNNCFLALCFKIKVHTQKHTSSNGKIKS